MSESRLSSFGWCPIFFVRDYDPSIEESYFVTMKVDGKSYVLDILDTAGSEEYSALRDVYTRNSYGFLVVYSITDRVLFDELDHFRKKIYTTQHNRKHIMNTFQSFESVRTVSIEEGEKLAEEWRVSFYETSAKNRININKIFIEVVSDIVRTKYKQKQVDDKYNKTCFSCIYFKMVKYNFIYFTFTMVSKLLIISCYFW
ncbi:hypothetical protein EIN_482010 [Entamoeba invadens IP1]|uniref:Ras n=1 Tax=Entamoeba invadens IP1 TaxID=370355 RepID=A0A0A1UD12_ENTIV|nr:hypothetical protein EIN_482010 [Entamoeba invadens IP1]ELP90187.1 hypothetical protein EIN_482010 [Entamoeba invadens IP1]|eukprot:XP_004256958.1 hypothetical protein EIN_482010 [Entamoeba invadens IP1]